GGDACSLSWERPSGPVTSSSVSAQDSNSAFRMGPTLLHRTRRDTPAPARQHSRPSASLTRPPRLFTRRGALVYCPSLDRSSPSPPDPSDEFREQAGS